MPRRAYYNDTGPKIAQILTEENSDWYTLITPYNVEFLQYFKGVVSSKRRKWDPEKKLWTFAPEYLIQVYYYCRQCYDDVIGDPQVMGKIQTKLEIKESPYAIMYLTNEAPDWLVEKVFKLLVADERSEYRHPDKGGDAEKTATLTMAMDKIKKRES
jgi:hypothetical protein